MKIEEVKKLDDGVSGISIEGRIIRVLKPRESQYGWSQFVVIKDDTGEMGSNINIENEEEKYQGGEYIKVKGKVSHYVKNDKPNVSLNGNVIDEITKVEEVSQEQPISQPKTQPINQPKEYTNNDYWREKSFRDIENNKCIVRECAIKAATEIASRGGSLITSETDYYRWADNVVDYINEREKITSEAITKEFGGTVEEKPENSHDNSDKDQKIAKAKEIVNQASQAQKDMVEKIIKSRYITEKEVKNIGDLATLTKDNASKYISYWFGSDEKLGERDKREMTEKMSEKEKKEKDNPFVTEREPLERKDKDDDTSLSKDMLIDKIQAKRKELHLEDDEKFEKTIGYNPKLEELTEEKLLKLKSLLKDWRPDWVKE